MLRQRDGVPNPNPTPTPTPTPNQVLRQRDGVLRLIDYGGAETFFRGDGLDKARCYYLLLLLLVTTIYSW